MANKIKKQKKQQKSAGVVISEQLIQYVLAAVLIVLCTVVPLYTKNGYYQIGDAKFTAYKYIMLIGFATLLICAVMYAAFACKDPLIKQNLRAKSGRELLRQFSATDYFVAGYLLFVVVSIINGGFYTEALWGYNGWYMGFLSQLSFVLLYFFVSRFARYWKAVLVIFCTVSAIVFGFGILHRLMIDPLGFYEGIQDWYKTQFLSTLGQASWYGSFLAVVIPIGIGVFLYARNRYLSAASAVFVFLSFCTLVTQNSDSVYSALLGFMLLFFWFAVKEKETFLRFLWVAVMLFGAGKTMRLLLYKYPNTIYSYDFVTNLILNTRISWILLIVLFVLALLLTVLKNKWNYPVKGMKWLCNVVFIVFGIVVVTIVCLIVLNAKGVLSQGMTARLSTIGYMNWGEEWGNGRGKTWAFTAEMFWEESVLHKLFGIGPDCYSAYATGLYQERLARIWPNNTLTNAHNEWFNMLINAGIIGAACYIGIFVSAVKRFTKAQDKTFMLITFSACIVSYMAYNFFCYQQVLCTPFIFMLIGMGEYIVRNE